MGYWGWRPLVCGVFLSVWVGGCAASAETTTLAPTEFPRVTLTVGRFLPYSTASPPPPTARPDAVVYVPPPTCYEMGTGELSCLGLVENRGAAVLLLDGGAVLVRLRDGDRLVERSAAFEQRQLLPGARTPYRVIFPRPLSDAPALEAQAILPGTSAPPVGLVALTPSEIALDWREGRYQVRALLTNEGETAALLLRTIIMLRGEAGVSGYRVVVAGERLLAPGAALPLRVEVAPLAGREADARPVVEIYAEARLSE